MTCVYTTGQNMDTHNAYVNYFQDTTRLWARENTWVFDRRLFPLFNLDFQ